MLFKDFGPVRRIHAHCQLSSIWFLFTGITVALTWNLSITDRAAIAAVIVAITSFLIWQVVEVNDTSIEWEAQKQQVMSVAYLGCLALCMFYLIIPYL